jgi:hypothetical protein
VTGSEVAVIDAMRHPWIMMFDPGPIRRPNPLATPAMILATVYEAEEDLTDTAYDNARKLLKLGCSVKTGVDATRLSDTIGKRHFRTIIFQFPNVAGRVAKLVEI